jgi:hypothetical protein
MWHINYITKERHWRVREELDRSPSLHSNEYPLWEDMSNGEFDRGFQKIEHAPGHDTRKIPRIEGWYAKAQCKGWLIGIYN